MSVFLAAAAPATTTQASEAQGAPIAEAAAAEAAPAAIATAESPVVLAAPAPGSSQVIAPQAGAVYSLAFAPRDVTVARDGGDLKLLFTPQGASGDEVGGEAGGEIVFQDIAGLAEAGAGPLFLIGQAEVPAALLLEQAGLLAGEAETPLETAGEALAQGGGAHGYSDDLGQVLELLSAQGVIDPTELSFRLIALEDETGLTRESAEAPEGSLLVNEIALGVETSLTIPLDGGLQIVDGIMNTVEFFNPGPGAFTTQDLTVEFLNPAGALVTLALPDGHTVPAGGFLVLYQFANLPGPSGDVFAQVFDAAGVAVDSFFLPAEAYWDLGSDTSAPLAVNLVQGAGSLDTFAANLETADLAVLTDPQWQAGPEAPAEFALLFETFNGQTSPLQTVFSRVFAGGDSDGAADWTTNGTATEGALNDVPDAPAPGPQDANPGDAWHDDLDPQQGNPDPQAGQTVQVAGDGGELLQGFGGPDFLFGGAGNDTLYGGSAAEVAAQGALNATEAGTLPEDGFSDHNDFLAGGAGDDALYGGAGADYLVGGQGADSLDGGSGDDHLYGHGAPLGGLPEDDAGLDDGNGDLLAGDGLNNQEGGEADALVNLGGDDTIHGGAGHDVIGGEAVAWRDAEAATALARNDDAAGPGEPEGNDRLFGEDGSDLMAGDALALSGSDDAAAMVMNLAQHGGTLGSDELAGGAGEDALSGDALAFADDGAARAGAIVAAVDGIAGNDTAAGGANHDFLAGEALALGEAAAESLAYVLADGAGSAAGNDLLRGQGGSDWLAGEALSYSGGDALAEAETEASNGAVAGSDTVNGGGGADLLAGDALAMGEGLVTAEALHRTDLGGIAGGDTLNGGSGGDLLAGDAMALGGPTATATVVNQGNGGGAAGSDSLTGGGGNDTLAGDALVAYGTASVQNEFSLGLPSLGQDTLHGGDGDDLISGDALALAGGTAVMDSLGLFVVPPQGDSILGGDGDDTIAGDALAVDGTAGVGVGGSDTILGGDGDDVISGDALVVGVGLTEVTGQGGFDSIDGGAGNDLIYGDANLGGGDVNGGDDTLLGGAGNDTIHGNGGNDVLDGGADDDSLLGGSGDDSLIGGLGDDFLDGGLGDDNLLGGLGDDYLAGNLGDDFLFGGSGGDFLFGGSGADTLVGGAGADTLAGGLDADSFSFGGALPGETDRVTDFNLGEGDVLDFGDLLLGVGADDGATLDDYLQVTWDGVHSTIGVDVNGDASGFTDHTVVVEGQDLTALGGTQDQILQALIDGGNLTGL